MERQTRAEPIQALAELVWNSVDADATDVNVDFVFGDLAGGLSKIIVSDNGHGLPRAEAGTMFGSLGGSWKRLAGRTKTKRRMIHGQEGRGRYKAFALGRSVEWKICYSDDGWPKAYSVSLLASSLTRVAITNEIDAPGRPIGTIVEIDDVRRNFQSLTSEICLQELAEIFALYLLNIIVGIKTWAEIIEENKARLQFFQEHLQLYVSESAAIRYLQERHAQFLEGVLEPDDVEADDTDGLTDDTEAAE